MKIETVAAELFESKLNASFASFSLKVQQISYLGNLDLLAERSFGLVCSSKCSGKIILQTNRLVKALAKSEKVIVSGFHSPVEKDCLDSIIRANGRLAICPARNIESMRIPVAWRAGIGSGRILVISPFDDQHQQVSKRLAEDRNRFVAMVSNELIVPNAEPGSKTDLFCREMLALEKKVWVSEDCDNPELVTLGATRTDFRPIIERSNSK